MKNDFLRSFISSSSVILLVTWSVNGQNKDIRVSDTGCSSNRHCDNRVGRCYLPQDEAARIGICACQNGLSNYPSCESDTHNHGICGKDCSISAGYCAKSAKCMCLYGGMYPETCCQRACRSGETCYKGDCTCKYGLRDDGKGCTLCSHACGPLEECNEQGNRAGCQCKYGGDYPKCKGEVRVCRRGERPSDKCRSQCKDDCGSLAECDERGLRAKCQCKYGGEFPRCKDKVRVDCTEVCGRDSSCRQDGNNKIICTDCGSGFILDKQTNSCIRVCKVGERPRSRECRSQCRDDCGRLAECDERGSRAQCQCKYGGQYPRCKDDVRLDCRELCGHDSSCHQDANNNIVCSDCGPGYILDKHANRCICEFGKKRDKSGCRLCRDDCGETATCDEKGLNARCQCKYGGFFPRCKPKITIIRDCREWCGHDSECHKDEKENIFCTKCRPGYKLDKEARCTLCEFGKLPNGRGCTHCEEDCGSLAECDEEAGEAGFRAQCHCKIGGEFPDCEDVDCTPRCGPGSECTKNNRGKIICTKCARGRRLIKKSKRCLYVGKWLKWEPCSVTCGVGVQIKKRACPRKPCLSRTRRQECSLQTDCFGEWETWKTWSKCSRSCGGGIRKRRRDCPNTTLGCGKGKSEELEECSTDECVAEVGDWGPWGNCPVCGPGLQNRTRPCLTLPAIKCNQTTLSESRPCADKPAGTFCTAPLHAVRNATIHRWKYISPNYAENWFDFSCEGGCIDSIQATATCDSSGGQIGPFVNAQCKGKTRCAFRPAPETFGLANCVRMMAVVSMSCVGGIPCNSHRQASRTQFGTQFG